MHFFVSVHAESQAFFAPRFKRNDWSNWFWSANEKIHFLVFVICSWLQSDFFRAQPVKKCFFFVIPIMVLWLWSIFNFRCQSCTSPREKNAGWFQIKLFLVFGKMFVTWKSLFIALTIKKYFSLQSKDQMHTYYQCTTFFLSKVQREIVVNCGFF